MIENQQDLYFQMDKNEVIVKRSKSSKKALIITWSSIPSFLLIVIFPNIPSLFKNMYYTGLLKDLLGILPTFLKVLFIISIIMCVITWLVLCLILTKRYMKYKLIITNYRIIGKADKEGLDETFENIKNVFIEQSIWGRILGYGTITIQAQSKTLSFYNVSYPHELYKIIMKYAENNYSY